MAEAFASIYGDGVVEAFSAGSQPSGKINEKALAAMSELNYDLTLHESKSINNFRGQKFDYVITMGCGDECPFIPATYHIDWEIPDPKNKEAILFNEVRDLIKNKVMKLISDIQNS